jgi:hypothetical protein
MIFKVKAFMIIRSVEPYFFGLNIETLALRMKRKVRKLYVIQK